MDTTKKINCFFRPTILLELHMMAQMSNQNKISSIVIKFWLIHYITAEERKKIPWIYFPGDCVHSARFLPTMSLGILANFVSGIHNRRFRSRHLGIRIITDPAAVQTAVGLLQGPVFWQYQIHFHKRIQTLIQRKFRHFGPF